MSSKDCQERPVSSSYACEMQQSSESMWKIFKEEELDYRMSRDPKYGAERAKTALRSAAGIKNLEKEGVLPAVTLIDK